MLHIYVTVVTTRVTHAILLLTTSQVLQMHTYKTADSYLQKQLPSLSEERLRNSNHFYRNYFNRNVHYIIQ
jgi:hypothetical protein